MSLNQHQKMVQSKLKKIYHLNKKVKAMHDQIEILRSLAESMNVNISGMPGNPNRNIHKMEDAVVNVFDLQAELTSEMECYINTIKEVRSYIAQVSDIDGQIILMRRYLLFERWEDIAYEMGFSVRNAHRIHDKAIDQIKIA